MQNLKALADAGYPVNDLADGEKAKMAYLAHHLGARDAKHFIEKEIEADHAEILLIQQVGPKLAEVWKDAGGDDYVQGHRMWLSKFIDDHIKINTECCQHPPLDNGRDLLVLTDYLSGNHKK